MSEKWWENDPVANNDAAAARDDWWANDPVATDGGPKRESRQSKATAADYLRAIETGLAQGVSGISGGLGTFIQDPAANALSGVSGAAAAADRGVTWAINALAGDGTAKTSDAIQENARTASRFAAESRAAQAADPSNLPARFGLMLQKDSERANREISARDKTTNPELIAQQQNTGQAEGFWDNLAAIKDNPLAFTNTMARSLPDMAAGVGVGSVAHRAGAGLSRVSTAGVLSESGSSAMQSRQGVYQQVNDMPLEALAKSPRYQAVLAETGGDAARARELLANELADQVPLLAGAGTALGTVLTNKLFGGDATAKTIAGVDKMGAREFGERVGQETVEELAQGLPEDAVQHGATVQADPSKKYDPAGSAAQNMAAGFAMGSGGHSLGYARDNLRGSEKAPAPAPNADKGLTADVTYAKPDGTTVTSTGTSPPADTVATGNTEAAEQALKTPVQLTALDRADTLSAELKALTERQQELDPANGYGPAFDGERQELATKAAELGAEREGITKTWPAAQRGSMGSFTTEAGARLEAQYALMDAADLVTSHDEGLRVNPSFPQEMQPRDRSRQASELQVASIVQKLDPARLGLSADAANGAPIVGADGLVESGNARTIALKRVYQANGQKAQDYKQFLRDNAAQFGITPESVEGMGKPVLVRVRATPVNRAEFARQANASTVQEMGPSEKALSDSKRLTTLEGLNPDEQGEFDNSTDFIRQFMATLPVTEQSGMIESDGRLSTAGYRRIQNAVLARAYGDSPSLRRMTESRDNNLLNISKALVRVAPTIASARERMDAGTMHQADIAPDLLAAVEGLSSLKDKGWKVADELGQGDLTGPKYSPESAELLTFLADNARSPRRIAEFFQRYYEALEHAGDPTQPSMFGDEGPAPTRAGLINKAKDTSNGNTDQNAQRGVAGEGAQPNEKDGGRPQDAPRDQGRDQGNGPAQADAAGRQPGKPAPAAADKGVDRDAQQVEPTKPEETPEQKPVKAGDTVTWEIKGKTVVGEVVRAPGRDGAATVRATSAEAGAGAKAGGVFSVQAERLKPLQKVEQKTKEGKALEPVLAENNAPDEKKAPATTTTASAGQNPKIDTPLQTTTPAFKKWFGDSKVVDAQGAPLVVYHATTADFNIFDRSAESIFSYGNNPDAGGIFFDADPKVVDNYSDPKQTGMRVLPVYLKIEKPAILPANMALDKQAAALKKAEEAGHDGAILGGLEYVVFRPEQIKSATGNSGAFDPDNPDIRFSRAVGKKASKTDEDAKRERDEAFARWSNNAPIVTSANASQHEFKSGEKIVVEAFHGTARPDRIGGVFDPKRATSGPMAFFTSSPELASTYATNKSDTSLADEDQSFENWFRYKPKGQRSDVDIARAWHSLTSEQKATIAERMPDIRTNDDGDVIYEKGGGDIGSYEWELKQTQRGYDKQGNPLKAAVETWLTSGTLFDNELDFVKVLRLAGFPTQDLQTDFPTDAFPSVFKTMIAMQSPLVVSDIPAQVMDALEQKAKTDRTRIQEGADQWDKRSRTVRQWVDQLNGKDGADPAYAWTSIPDKVTDVLKSFGYDGIVDWIGKGGGHQHPVYIPFTSTQVKGAFNRGTYDIGKKDINFSRDKPTTPADSSERNATASAFEPLADQSTAQALNASLISYGLGQDWSNAYAAVKLPDALSGVRDAIQAAFGRDVRSVAPTAAKFDLFNGIYLPSQPGAVYVNAAANVGFVNIAGHELWHVIKRERPGLIDWYRQNSRQFYKDLPAYQKRLNKLVQPGEKQYDALAAEEELEADFMGDSLADPAFLQQLADASPSKFRSLLNSVQRWLAGVAQKLRAKGLGSSQEVSDVEALRGYLKEVLVAFVEGRALPDAPPVATSQTAREESSAPAFSFAESAGEKALAEFAKADELFALPKSTKDTVEGVAGDNDANFTISKPVNMGGRMEYTLTMPDKTKATLSVREPNPFGGEQVYDTIYTDDGMELVAGRPGVNPEDVPPTGDVWIDVSALKKGDFGAKMYNIAATYAHNTGRIFIGDPHGLSKDALRRRLEQMLSSALKFGTTAHLAPHPDQVRGGHGVPPLRWVYGDHVGNVERMIAASVKALDNGFPQSKTIEYRDDGNFYSAKTGRKLSRGVLAAGLQQSIADRRANPGAEGSTGQAGWRTVARAALFRHLQSTIGDASSGLQERGGLLARGGSNVARLNRGETGSGSFDKQERIFYSRTKRDGLNPHDQTQTPAFKKWFGDSQVVDAQGAPLVVYHGTTADFNSFDEEFVGDNFGRDKEGFFFTGSAVEASGYADENSVGLAAGMSDSRRVAPKEGANVLPVYLALKNPLTLEKYTRAIASTPEVEIDEQGISLIDFFDGTNGAATAYANAKGYDGLFFQHKGKTLAVVLTPTQIKSAIGNSGDFDPNNPDIRMSRTERAANQSGMPVDELQALADRIADKNPRMPKVNVLADPSKAPKALRDYITEQGAENDVDGAMHNGQLYLFASGLTDALRAEHVLLEHEAAHFGLRAILGDSLTQAMNLIYANNGAVRKAATEMQRYGKLSNAAAVEEVIVDMPSSQLARLNGWRKVAAMARDLLAAQGFTAMAEKISTWLDGTLSDQQRADLFVADLVRGARAYVAGKGRATSGAKVAGTRLSATLADDLARQEKWLMREAKERGYKDIEDLLEKNYPVFEKLAELWRKKHPEATLLSRGTPVPAPDAAARAEAIIQDKTGGARPLDAMARMITRATGVERLTGAIYDKAGALLAAVVPEKVKAGVMSDYGLPESVKDQRTMLQGRQRVQLRKAGSLIEKLATLTRAESRVAYEWMNMDGADPQAYLSMMDGLPEESVQVLQEVQAMIDKLSQDAVRLGQLEPEAFKRNRFAYLRRSYAKHTLEQTKGEKAKRARTISVLGEQYKGRGLTQSASMDAIKNAAPEWWQRKMVKGKADTSLKGEMLVRLERRAPSGERTKPIEGMASKAAGRVLEVAYWPASERLPSRYADWTPAGTWEVRDVKGANAVLWRDFTKAEREQMGEIDEARFAIAKTLHAMITDVETGRYLEWLAVNLAKKEGETIPGELVDASEKYRDTFPPGQWVQVPESKIPGTTVLKYGKLAGRYIEGPVWNDLRQMTGSGFQPFGDTYSKVLNMWKMSKTALSPSVHMNNVMSNFVMADWHDVHATHVSKALRILLAASDKKGGIKGRDAAREILTRYADSGGDSGSWVTNEIASDQIEPLLKSLELEMEQNNGGNSETHTGVYAALQHALQMRFPESLSAAEASLPGRIVKKIGGTLLDAYQAEDDVFRLGAWLAAKEQGATDLEAGKRAKSSFLDYSINAPWINAMRKSFWPFFSFTYRAVPMLLETAARKPHKLLKLMAIAGGLNALGAMLAGGDDDKDRKLLPEEKAGSIWGMVPKLVRMPWNDGHNSPVYLDIRRFVPVGDVVDIHQGQSALPIPPGLQPGGPLVILGELVINKSAFTGKPITLGTDTAGEQTEKILGHLYKAATPNILGLPGTYATTGVSVAMDGGTDKFGREMSVPQAVASSFGVKLGSYPADVMRKNVMGRFKMEKMELDMNIGQLKRQYQTNRIGEEEFRAKVQTQQDKQRKLVQELREKLE